jgi:tetratricopeptide (TPR) repeat protein
MDSKNIESALTLLNTSQQPTVNWDTIAQNCFYNAQQHLHNDYNYNEAIKWLTPIVDLYEKNLLNTTKETLVIPTYTDLALLHHHIGSHEIRDSFLKKVQDALHIPDTIEEASSEIWNEQTCDYCIVNGYRHYVHYEDCHKNNKPILQQKEHLSRAKKWFTQAIEITNKYPGKEFSQSHAFQGLGTTYEFLNKCEQTEGNTTQATLYLQKSTHAFEQALNLRKSLLGKSHPHVARSYHKLARNYALTSALLNNQAKEFYQTAQTIYEHNTIPPTQAKRKELEEEFALFLKNFHTHSD